MRCKDIERLMIDGMDRTLLRQESEAVERHLARCLTCAQFREDLDKIRNGLRSYSYPAPSDELVQTTKSLCYTEMDACAVSDSNTAYWNQRKPVPKIIWAAVFTLVVLTGIFFISLLPGFEIEQSLSLKTVLTFTLIVQNAAMLFFAPVLIQKFRSPKNGLNINGYDNIVP